MTTQADSKGTFGSALWQGQFNIESSVLKSSWISSYKTKGSSHTFLPLSTTHFHLYSSNWRACLMFSIGHAPNGLLLAWSHQTRRSSIVGKVLRRHLWAVRRVCTADRRQLCPLQLLEASLSWMSRALSVVMEKNQFMLCENKYFRQYLREQGDLSSRRSCPTSMTLSLHWLKVKEGISD